MKKIEYTCPLCKKITYWKDYPKKYACPCGHIEYAMEMRINAEKYRKLTNGKYNYFSNDVKVKPVKLKYHEIKCWICRKIIIPGKMDKYIKLLDFNNHGHKYHKVKKGYHTRIAIYYCNDCYNFIQDQIIVEGGG